MGSQYVSGFTFLNKAHLDFDGSWKKISPSLCKYLGYTEDELLTQKFSEVSYSNDAAEGGNLSDIKKETEFDHRFVHKSGKILSANVKAIRVDNDDSSESGFVAIYVTDITRYKESQQKLEQQVELNQKFMNAIDEGYLLINRDGIIMDVNPAYCEITGFSRDEAISRSMADVRPDIDKKELDELINLVIEKGNLSFDTYHKTKDGNIKELEARTTAFKLNDSVMIAGFVRDVTNQRRAQQELSESEERWHRLVEHNPLPVLISANGIIKFVNKAGLDLYGVDTEDEVLDRSVFDFIDPESSEKVRNRIKKLERDEVLPPSVQRIINVNGEKRFVEVHSIPIKYKGKQAVQTVLRDITETKEREEQITDSLKEKETLLKEIHHRVKNNLAVISGLIELQAMNTDDESTLNTLRDSQLRIKSIAMIHEKLYQSEALSDIGFDVYLEELVHSISQTYRSENRKIDITYDLEQISLDLDQAIPCSLIVNEIIVNCFKHAFDKPQGRIEISSAFSDPIVTVKIQDNGRGLPDDIDLNDTSSLGMTLVQTLATQLDGEITFSSDNQQKGTVFELKFTKS